MNKDFLRYCVDEERGEINPLGLEVIYRYAAERGRKRGSPLVLVMMLNSIADIYFERIERDAYPLKREIG